MLAAQFIEVVSAHFSESSRLTPPLSVAVPPLDLEEFPWSSSRTGELVDRSAGTPVAHVGEETSTPVAPSTSRQPAPATRFASFRVDLVLAAQFMAADGANPFA